MDIGTPKFYTDLISYRKARGFNTGAIVTGSNLLDFQSGTIDVVFDLRPLNLVSFDTTSDSGQDHVLFEFNLGATTRRVNYIAILNHNLATCTGKIRIGIADASAEVDDVDLPNADATTNMTCTEVVNADDINIATPNIFIDPATDGTTIFKLQRSSADITGERYWGIQFEGTTSETSATAADGTFAADLTIGGIMIGESYESVSPDMKVRRSIIYDKVNILESAGGQRYGNATSFGRTGTTTTKSPFTTANYNTYNHGGRLAFDLNFSYLANTDIMPDQYDYIVWSDDSVLGDVWNITDGPHRPFIFSVDKDDTGDNAESSHIFARFRQNSLDMDQVAFKLWSCSLKIEEEF